MSNPKRLHPISAVANCLKQIKELIIPFLIFVVFGSLDGAIQLLITGGVVVIILAAGILSWLRFTYRLEEGELRIEYGVFVRKKRYIPLERIQSLDLSEGILHRPFGLVKVKVETAGTRGKEEAEAILTAISKEEANQIQQVLFSARRSFQGTIKETLAAEQFEEYFYKISSGQLLLLASTSGGAGVVISAVFAFIFQFEEIIPYERVFHGIEDVISNGIIFISILIFLVFLFAWIIALVGSMIKYAGFTVKKAGQDIIITRGLLEKKQITIPLERIQAVRISENPIRQMLGLSAVYVESAGGSASDNESSRLVILPIIKKNQITALLNPYLKEYLFDRVLRPAPRRAFKRYLVREGIIFLPLIIIPIILFRPWGYLALIFAVISIIWSYLKYKDAGWNVENQQLTLRYRTIIKHTVFMQRNRIQSLKIKESLWQSKKELATITAAVMSGSGGTGGTVADLEKKEIDAIYRWYSYTKY